MLVVGLTGNYGAGKSLVLKVFGDLGALTIDADRVVASLLEEKAVLEKLRKLFGPDAFDNEGRLIKERVSAMAFSNEPLRRSLEDLLHPLVFEKIEGLIESSKAAIAVVEAPVIFERGYEDKFDKIIAVYADEETALKRLAAKGVKREDALLRLKSQLPADEKKKRADYVIDNGGSPEETARQAGRIFEKLLRGSKERGL